METNNKGPAVGANAEDFKRKQIEEALGRMKAGFGALMQGDEQQAGWKQILLDKINATISDPVARRVAIEKLESAFSKLDAARIKATHDLGEKVNEIKKQYGI